MPDPEWLKSDERDQQIRRMVAVSGSLIGRDAANTKFFVEDGRVYACPVEGHVREPVDYYEFMAVVRAGLIEGYTRELTT